MIDNHYHFVFMILIRLMFLMEESVVKRRTFAPAGENMKGKRGLSGWAVNPSRMGSLGHRSQVLFSGPCCTQ
jgi:hypothetical protein